MLLDRWVVLGEALEGLEPSSWAAVARACLSGAAGAGDAEGMVRVAQEAASDACRPGLSEEDRRRVRVACLGALMAAGVEESGLPAASVPHLVACVVIPTVAGPGLSLSARDAALRVLVGAMGSTSTDGYTAAPEVSAAAAAALRVRMAQRDRAGERAGGSDTGAEALAKEFAAGPRRPLPEAVGDASVGWHEDVALLLHQAALQGAGRAREAAALVGTASAFESPAMACVAGAGGEDLARRVLQAGVLPTVAALAGADDAPSAECLGSYLRGGLAAALGLLEAAVRAGALWAPGDGVAGEGAEVAAAGEGEGEGSMRGPPTSLPGPAAAALGLSVLTQLGTHLLPPDGRGPVDARNDPALWALLPAALASDDTLVRKRAAHVLGLAVPIGHSRTHRPWAAFQSVLGALEDFSLQLVEHAWKDMPAVFPGEGASQVGVATLEGAAEEKGAATEVDTVWAKVEGRLTPAWALVLYARAFQHRNVGVVKMALGSFLQEVEWTPERLAAVPAPFVSKHLAPALARPTSAAGPAQSEQSPWEGAEGDAATAFLTRRAASMDPEDALVLVGAILDGALTKSQVSRVALAACLGSASAVAAGVSRGAAPPLAPPALSSAIVARLTDAVALVNRVPGPVVRHKLLAHVAATLRLAVRPTRALLPRALRLVAALPLEALSPLFTPRAVSLTQCDGRGPGFPPPEHPPLFPGASNPVLAWTLAWLSGPDEEASDSRAGPVPFLEAAVREMVDAYLGEGGATSKQGEAQAVGAGEVGAWAGEAARVARVCMLHAASVGLWGGGEGGAGRPRPGVEGLRAWMGAAAGAASRAFRRQYGPRGHAERAVALLGALLGEEEQQMRCLRGAARAGAAAEEGERYAVALQAAVGAGLLGQCAAGVAEVARAWLGDALGAQAEGVADARASLAASCLSRAYLVCRGVLESGVEWAALVGACLPALADAPEGVPAHTTPEAQADWLDAVAGREAAAALGELMPVAEWFGERAAASGRAAAWDALATLVAGALGPAPAQPGTASGHPAGAEAPAARRGSVLAAARDMAREMAARVARGAPGCAAAVARGALAGGAVPGAAWRALAALVGEGGAGLRGVLPRDQSGRLLGRAVSSATEGAGAALLPLLEVVAVLSEAVLQDAAQGAQCGEELGVGEGGAAGWYGRLVGVAGEVLLGMRRNRVPAVVSALLRATLPAALFARADLAPLHGPGGPARAWVAAVWAEGERSPRVARLAALHLCRVWGRWPRSALPHLDTLRAMLLSLEGWGRREAHTGAEGGDADDHGAEGQGLGRWGATEHAPRLAALGMLEGLCAGAVGGGAGAGDAALVARVVAGSLLWDAVEDPVLASGSYMDRSPTHRGKVRLWQALGVLSNAVADPRALAAAAQMGDADLAKATAAMEGTAIPCDASDLMSRSSPPSALATAEAALRRNEAPGVRRLAEAFLTRLVASDATLPVTFLAPRLGDFSSQHEAAVSLVAVAARMLLRPPSPAAAGPLLRALVPRLLPWATSHIHGLRSMALIAMFQVLGAYPPGHPAWAVGEPGTAGKANGGGAVGAQGAEGVGVACLSALQAFCAANEETQRMVAAVAPHLSSPDPRAWVGVQEVFNLTASAPGHSGKKGEPPFEGCPASLLSAVLAFVGAERRAALAVLRGAAVAEGVAEGGGQAGTQRKVTPMAGRDRGCSARDAGRGGRGIGGGCGWSGGPACPAPPSPRCVGHGGGRFPGRQGAQPGGAVAHVRGAGRVTAGAPVPVWSARPQLL